jgi:Terminase large subunit, T4likevirus-type, N-terminal
MLIPFEGITINGDYVYRPQPKQQTFHNAIANRAENGYRDFLYGGSAKGGKSHALRWEAHRNCLQYPGVRGLLVRSSFPELERTHLNRLQFDLPKQAAKYNQQTHVYGYANNSVFEFGYGDRKQDFDQYLSAEYDFILIDELTTIPFEFSYLLRSRLAASRKDFIPFWACATNPGSIAHAEVKKYFITKQGLDSEEFPDYRPSEVCFIPANVYDNKILLDRDPAVLTRLQQLSKRDQQKYLFGNWDIFEGQFFDEWFSDVHVVKPADYLTYDQIKLYNTIAGMDYGHYTAVEYQFKDYNGNVCVFDEWSDIKSVRSVKVADLKKFAADRVLMDIDIEADTNLWNPDGFDMQYKTSPSEDFIAAGLKLRRVSKSARSRATENRGYRIACNEHIKNALHWQAGEEGSLIVKPRLMVYERCHKLIETIPMLQVDEKNVEDTKDMGDVDTWYDAFKMGFMPLYTPSEPAKPKEKWVQDWDKRRLAANEKWEAGAD